MFTVKRQLLTIKAEVHMGEFCAWIKLKMVNRG